MRTARGSVSFKHEEDNINTSNPNANVITYFQKPSQSERTITQYKGYSGVDTKVDPKSIIKYPYYKGINFVSNSLSGFIDIFWKRRSLL